MAAQSVQIVYNDAEIRLMWDFDITGVFQRYNLYWSVDSGMAGEAAVMSNIPNTPGNIYSPKHVFVKFKRETIGLTNDSVFYVRIKGVNSLGVEDPGPIRYIPSLLEQIDHNNAAQIYGYDYTNKIWRRVKVLDTGALA